MKTIKFILIFISIVFIVFITTGLFIKQTEYDVMVTINKPVEEVFAAFNNKEATKNWVSDLKKIDTINSKMGKIGSEFRLLINNQDQDLTINEKIIAYVPNEKVTLFYDAENILKTNDYIFEEFNDNTIIKLNTTTISESYIMACVFPYFKWVLEDQDQEYLNNFKAYLEKK